MDLMNCSSIKDSLLEHLREGMEVAAFRDYCVLTLPIKTLDDRFVEITIERKFEDYFLVHDGGKSLSELFLQGVNLTDSVRTHLEGIAKANRVELNKELFVVGCSRSGLEGAILSVSLCAVSAMLELIGHQPVVEDEPISSRISRSLRKWQPQYVQSIERQFTIQGKRFPHKFNFVIFPTDSPQHHTSAIKVLTSAYRGSVQAERYAFLVLDIENTRYYKWPRLAVITKAEAWPLSARKMVASLSERTLEVESGQEALVEQELPVYLNQLA